LMHEPEARLKVQDGLADHRKAEVPRFDHPGMNRADRDLIHPVSLDRAKRIRAVDVAELGRVPGVLQHRVPAFRPMKVSNQPAGERMAGRHDPEQIPHLAFKTPGTKGLPRQGWNMRMRTI